MTNIDFTQPIEYQGHKYFIRSIRERIGDSLYLRNFSEQTKDMYVELYPDKFIQISELEIFKN